MPTRRISIPEEQVEAEVRFSAARAHVELLVTSTKLKPVRCRECGTWSMPKSDAGTGADLGVPDTIQMPVWMPPYLGALVELKGTDTDIRPAQRDLAARRRIAVIRPVSRSEEAWEQTQRILSYLERLLQPTREKYFVDGRWPELEEL